MSDDVIEEGIRAAKEMNDAREATQLLCSHVGAQVLLTASTQWVMCGRCGMQLNRDRVVMLTRYVRTNANVTASPPVGTETFALHHTIQEVR